jgi:hypothetical protein
MLYQYVRCEIDTDSGQEGGEDVQTYRDLRNEYAVIDERRGCLRHSRQCLQQIEIKASDRSEYQSQNQYGVA